MVHHYGKYNSALNCFLAGDFFNATGKQKVVAVLTGEEWV